MKNFSRLRKLDCDAKEFNDKQAYSLFSKFQLTTQLTELHLNDSRLSSTSFGYFISSLPYIQSLKYLDIGSNNIGDNTMELLGKSLSYVKNLQIFYIDSILKIL